MTIRQPVPPALAYALLALIMALGLALRAWHLGAESLWLDEAHSILQAKAWWKTIWVLNTRAEPNPPLYFTLLKFWMRAFGDSEAAVRSLSVLFGTLTIAVVFVFARLAGGTALGLAAAGVAATSPLLVIYSRDTRGYALAILAATVSLSGALRLLTRLGPMRDRSPHPSPGRLAWAAYVGGAVVAIYTHTTLLLLPFVANIAAAIVWASAPRRGWPFVWRWCLANAAIVAIYLPWLPNVLHGSVVTGNFWIRPVTFDAALEIVHLVYGQVYVPLAPWPDVVVAVAALAGLVALRRSVPALALVLAPVILVPLLTYLISLYQPVLIPRVLLWPLPFLAVAIAAGALVVPNRALAAALVVAIIVGQAVGLADPRATIKDEPWREIVERIRRDRQPGDAIVLAPSYYGMPFEYYAGRDGDVLTVELLGPARPTSQWSYTVIAADEMLAHVADRRRVWFISRAGMLSGLVEPVAAQLAPTFELVDDRAEQSLKLRLFVRRP